MLRDGDCFEKDNKLALKFLKRAADYGNLDAMFIYGVELFNNENPLYKNEAIMIIRDAAKKGHKDAKQFLIQNDISGNNKKYNANYRGNH